MDEETIEVGTTVELPSGGPTMTVEELLINDTATCVWFDDYNDIVYRSVFKRAALQIV